MRRTRGRPRQRAQQVRVRGSSLARCAGGGARCRTASASPASRPSVAGVVEVAEQRQRAGSAQASATRGARRQREHAPAPARAADDAHADVAAADDQQHRSLEARRSVGHGGRQWRRRRGAFGGRAASGHNRGPSLGDAPAPPLPSSHAFHRHRPAERQDLQRRARRADPAAAIRQGIGLPYGCRDGACGSCKSRCSKAA